MRRRDNLEKLNLLDCFVAALFAMTERRAIPSKIALYWSTFPANGPVLRQAERPAAIGRCKSDRGWFADFARKPWGLSVFRLGERPDAISRCKSDRGWFADFARKPWATTTAPP